MKIALARALLLTLFLASVAVQAGMLLALILHHALTWQEAEPLLELLARAYSVPFAMVIAGMFANHAIWGEKVHPFALLSAFAVSVVWNLLLIIPVWIYYTADNMAPEAVDHALRRGASFHFLVAGVLGYFFAAPSDPSSPRVPSETGRTGVAV